MCRVYGFVKIKVFAKKNSLDYDIRSMCPICSLEQRNLGVKKKFEDTKSEAVNRRTDNTCNAQKKKRTNNDIQNITQETKDRATLTPLKTGGELGYSGRVSSFRSTCGTCPVTLSRPLINECRIYIELYTYWTNQIHTSYLG